ncbi:MAG: hypothetical protein HQL46_05885 [Gammaproteobacteria bacterium]|nr:hypothetical protein [Gammaproteobacteria bacterium]
MDFRQKNKDKKILTALYAKSGQYQNLKQKLMPMLPNNLTALLVDVSYISGVLTLYFSKQIALNQCRFILPQLMKQLKMENQFQLLKKIQPIIATKAYKKQGDVVAIDNINQDTSKASKNPNLLYSNRSAKMLSDLADTTSDSGLKESLIRLAKDMSEKKETGE